MEYPKVMYGKKHNGQVVTIVVASRAEEDELPAGWVDSQLKLGIETHPQARAPAAVVSEPVDDLGRPVVDPGAVVDTAKDDTLQSDE